ncbi:hypothetical protein LTR56_023658 [Elasticomyces elasticus]|nr:hypothetical protein LTR56_023658 [Elasticomyces elasticus]KAK3624994.1 hypothetical protein LTR22_023743 [Elasticomyces elasticus]KAK4906591.1 hypothetical protein LTR49_024287 [Elasticomyces elasticus]KAK5768099.1 hypothetical protein LTS12_001583 [Elasticomyces elasticus]
MPAGEHHPNVLDTATALRPSPSSSFSSLRNWETSDFVAESDIPAQLFRTRTTPSRGSPPENLRLQPGPQRMVTVIEGGPRIESAHGSICEASIHESPAQPAANRETIYGNPRPAPAPPTRQRPHHDLNRGVQPETSFNVSDGDAILVPDARNVPYGSNDRPDTPRRAGTFASIRKGITRIGTFSKRTPGVADLPIRVVKNQDHELSKPTMTIQKAQAKQAAEREAYLKANPHTDADNRYPNALPPRRRPTRAGTSAAPVATRNPAAPLNEPRRVRRLSGDSRRQTTFGGFIDACNRSDTSSDSGREDRAQLQRVTDGAYTNTQARQASRHQDSNNRQTWQTADILNVRGLEPLDVDFTGCKGEPAPVAPDSLPIRPIHRKPVPQVNTGVNKPLPEVPGMPKAPRNTLYFGGIPQDAAEAFGCDDDGNARIVPSKEDLDEAVNKANRLIAAEGRDAIRRPSDDGHNESIESEIRRYHLDAEEEAALIEEAYRLKGKLPRRSARTAMTSKDNDENDEMTIDHIVRDSHVSVLITRQSDSNTIESFRSQQPRHDYSNENNDEAAALYARLERERLGLTTSERHGKARRNLSEGRRNITSA